MHQDVYNQAFDGEGAPAWAVCTNDVRATDPPGRWSQRVLDDRGGHRLQSLLEERRPRQPAGPVRPGVGRRGPGLQAATPGSSGTTPSTSPSRRRSSLRRRALRRPAAVLLHRDQGTSRIHLTGSPNLHCPRTDPVDRRGADHPGQRPVASRLRRARQLRHPRLRDVPRPDAAAQPRLQRPPLLRRTQPRHREPDQRGSVLPSRRRTPSRRQTGADARDGVAHAARRSGLARDRVRGDEQRALPREHHLHHGCRAGGMDLLVVEVLRRSHREQGRVRW